MTFIRGIKPGMKWEVHAPKNLRPEISGDAVFVIPRTKSDTGKTRMEGWQHVVLIREC